MDLNRRTCIGAICSVLAFFLNPFRRPKSQAEIPPKVLVEAPEEQPDLFTDDRFYAEVAKELYGPNTHPTHMSLTRIFCARFNQLLGMSDQREAERPLTDMVYRMSMALLNFRGLTRERRPSLAAMQSPVCISTRVKDLDVDQLRTFNSVPVLLHHLKRMTEDLVEQHRKLGSPVIISRGVHMGRCAYLLTLSMYMDAGDGKPTETIVTA